MSKAFNNYLRSQAQLDQMVKKEINLIDNYINNYVASGLFQLNTKIEHLATVEALKSYYSSKGYEVKYYERNHEMSISWAYKVKGPKEITTLDYNVEANRNWFLTVEVCTQEFIEDIYRKIEAAIEEGFFSVSESYNFSELDIGKVAKALIEDGYKINDKYVGDEEVEMKISWDFRK